MRRGFAALLGSSVVVCSFGSSCSRSTADGPYVPRAEGTLTFNEDIAPIVFEKCSVCHRPDGGGPFDLLTYDDVRARSKQIAVVTEDRYMPPWLPTVGRGKFAGERALSNDQIGMIAQWSREGCKEGDPGDLPPLPTWPEGWTLGTPDLVLELPEEYELVADGADVYRNFVLSVPLEQPVYVRALEFDPGNPRVVHHAFVLLDPTDKSRLLDEESPGPGFGDLADMVLPESVISPGDGGFFIGWNPGKRAFGGYEDMAWQLEPTTDVVLQLHMRPSGKTERVRPSIALYFADEPPTRFPLVIGLRSIFIDIPAGEKDYSFELDYTLPVDVDVLGVLPHAHYIGKHLQGFAELPDGTKKWLIDIEDWDFNWQGDYRYEEPVFLPKGTRIVQSFSYDNSSSNPRNPVSPPEHVGAGPSSLDEMGELWLQVLPRRADQRAGLERHWRRFFAGIQTPAFRLELIAKGMERKALEALEEDPGDSSALLDMAKCRGRENRLDEAIDYAERAIEVAADPAEPHYLLGHLLLKRGGDGAPRAAFEHFTRAIRLRPDFFEAHNAIGLLWKRSGDRARAAQAFATSHELAPQDPFALYNLAVLAAEQGNMEEAVRLFQETLSVEPSYKPAIDALAQIEARFPASPEEESSE